MTRGCDQELCPYWDGEGCPCRVLGIEEHERRAEQRRLGIEGIDYDDEDGGS